MQVCRENESSESNLREVVDSPRYVEEILEYPMSSCRTRDKEHSRRREKCGVVVVVG